MIYGPYVYPFHSQYSFNLRYQGMSPYGWQFVGNVLAVISGLIAAGLYGNIGIKVFCNNIHMDLCRAPPLTTTSGKQLWAAIVPIYWSVAFVVAASIPNFFGLVSVVAAFCVIQFCYSFPPLLALGFWIQKNAMGQDEGFDPATGVVSRHDSGIRRRARGFFSKSWYMNVWRVIYLGSAPATAGLGAYASIEAIIIVFQNPQVNSFACRSSLNLALP